MNSTKAAMTEIKSIYNHSALSNHWLGSHISGAYPEALRKLFPPEMMQMAQKEIASWESYQPTELRSLDEIAGHIGIADLHYKDESTRFGLGSFKALGGAYAVLNYLSGILSERLGREISMTEIRAGSFAEAASSITVATATDGNHGRSVAWGAKQAGCKCRIYIHAEVSKGREEAMAEFGADVIRINGDYDESVRLAAKEAAENGWQIISDTSYDGYLDIPRQVMAGYTVMVQEVLETLSEPPTHVIVQAGVGGLAAAICASFWSELGAKRPRFIVTESDKAACILESMKNNKPSHVSIQDETIMAGLSCGEISLIAWEILSRGTNAVTTLPDDNVGAVMRYMASQGIEAGECAVPGIIALMAIAKDDRLKAALEIDNTSRVLVFGCEGATDPELYNSIVKGEA